MRASADAARGTCTDVWNGQHVLRRHGQQAEARRLRGRGGAHRRHQRRRQQAAELDQGERRRRRRGQGSLLRRIGEELGCSGISHPAQQRRVKQPAGAQRDGRTRLDRAAEQRRGAHRRQQEDGRRRRQRRKLRQPGRTHGIGGQHHGIGAAQQQHGRPAAQVGHGPVHGPDVQQFGVGQERCGRLVRL